MKKDYYSIGGWKSQGIEDEYKAAFRKVESEADLNLISDQLLQLATSLKNLERMKPDAQVINNVIIDNLVLVGLALVDIAQERNIALTGTSADFSSLYTDLSGN
jgi:hypothetical protein